MRSLVTIILVGIACTVQAQWNTSGNHINNTNTGNVGIGTTSPGHKLHIVGSNASTNSFAQSANVVSSTVGNEAVFGGTTMNNDPIYGAMFVGARARDNSGSPGSVLLDDVLTGLYGRGYSGSGSGWGGNIAAIRILAGENFSSTSQGTKIDFGTTPIGGTVRATRMTIDPSGNVGLGTSEPQRKFHVQDNLNNISGVMISNTNTGTSATSNVVVQSSKGNFVMEVYGTNYSSNILGIPAAGAGMLFSSGGAALTKVAIGTRTDIPLHLSTNDVVRMTVSGTGNVGIGTSNPDAKLTVKGIIHTEEVKVDLTVPGPDYVFEPTYNLPTLAETEAYIKANKHLPEVPSAKEMEANGINLSEMNMLLLKKVEELTLHVIELKKEIDELKVKNHE